MISVGCRTRAALCHLSTLTVIGIFWVPFLLGFVPEEEHPEFYTTHRYGALCYQILGLIGFGLGAALSYLPGRFTDEFTAGAVLAFFWVVYLCLFGIYLLIAVFLAIQAWSGQEFHLGFLDRFVYD